MKHLIYLALLLLATSCQFFETEKISSEAFYEEEIKTIDWEDIDQYPTFPDCEAYTEKMDKKVCFETTLSQTIHRTLASKNIRIHQDLSDTVLLDFYILKTGEISSLNIEMDSVIEQKLPLLRGWLTQSIDSLPKLAPGYKRGMPVKTKFTLPLVIQTQKPTN